jgi:large repetitive protein
VRSEVVKGALYRAAMVAALLTLASACAPILSKTVPATPSTSAASSPTPSPSPSPSASASATAAILAEAATPPYHGGEVAVAYRTVGMTASGGVAPYTWTIGAGALPDGLSLSTDGHVTGTPTRAGHFSFAVVVSDGGGGKASLNGSATIVAAVTATFLRACGSTGKCSVEQGCNSACGGFGYQGGGTAPYSYSLTGGSVPPGTYQYGLSLAGTFSTTGTYNFKATVTDGFGATASVSPTFTVFPHISLSGGSIPTSPNNGCFAIDAPAGACTASFLYSGGTPNAGTPTPAATWISNTCTEAPLPTITIGTSKVTIAVQSGLPTCNGWSGTLSVTLTNRDICAPGPSHCAAAARFTITVLGT